MTDSLRILNELADLFAEYRKAANRFEQTEASVEYVKGWGKPDVIQRRQDDLHRDKCIRDEKLALLDKKLDEYIDSKFGAAIEMAVDRAISRRQINVSGIQVQTGPGPAF